MGQKAADDTMTFAPVGTGGDYNSTKGLAQIMASLDLKNGYRTGRRGG